MGLRSTSTAHFEIQVGTELTQSAIQGRPFAVGSLLAISGGTIGVKFDVGPLAFSTMALMLALAIGVVAAPKGRAGSFRVNPFDFGAILFICVNVAIELINGDSLKHPANLAYATAPIYYFAAYVAARLAVTNTGEMKRFLLGFVWPAVPISGLAALQLVGFAPVRDFLFAFVENSSSLTRYEAGSATRATSLLGHWSAMGGYLCCLLTAGVMLLMLMRNKINERRARLYVVVAVGFAVIGVVTTLTFVVYFLAAIVLTYAAYRSGLSKWVLALGAGGGVVLWLQLGSLIVDRVDSQTASSSYVPIEYSWLPQTVGYRMVKWVTEGIPSFLERPLTGWGQAVYKDSGSWPVRPSNLLFPSPESEWLKTLVVGGVIDFIALAALIWTMAVLIRRARRGPLGKVASPVGWLVFGLFLGSFIHPYFTNAGVPAALWPLLGALAWSTPTASQGSLGSVDRAGVTAGFARRKLG